MVEEHRADEREEGRRGERGEEKLVEKKAKGDGGSGGSSVAETGGRACLTTACWGLALSLSLVSIAIVVLLIKHDIGEFIFVFIILVPVCFYNYSFLSHLINTSAIHATQSVADIDRPSPFALISSG